MQKDHPNIVEPIGVIGLGHVGLPTALGLAELGWTVIGTDDDRAKAGQIAQGLAPFYEPSLEDVLRAHLRSGRFQVAFDTGEVVQRSSVLFVCVGTPLSSDGDTDLSQVEAVTRTIARHMNGYKLIVEKSTTPVGTAEQIEQTLARYTNGQYHFDVAVNPEFLREGQALKDFLSPDRIVLGVETERARAILTNLYTPLLQRLPQGGAGRLLIVKRQTAELIKHASNAFLATKISFINLIADLCDITGSDVTQVSYALGLDPRIGPSFLQAGVGFGGSCLPKDLRAFIRIGESRGVDMTLLREVDRINLQRVDRVIAKLQKALWILKGKQITILGLAFKAGTDDIREAPSLRVVECLLQKGATLRLHDPWAMPAFQRHFPEETGRIVYCTSPYEAAQGSHALLLLTEWPEYIDLDFSALRKVMEMPILVDGRNALPPERVRQAGFEYYGIGR